MSVRLLVCDDHPVVREGLSGMFRGEPGFEVVGEARDGKEAVALTEELEPNVVLMDLRMPEMDGVTAIARIKQGRPETRILVLTTYDTDADILLAIETGAAGYLLKDAPPEELFGAVRAVARGENLSTPAEVAAVLSRRRARGGREALSAREVEILALVARGSSNKDIARELWIGENTVKSHIKSIISKLGAADRTAAVTEALRRGILRL